MPDVRRRLGRAQRRAANQTPDANSVAHVLRVVGSILDHRGGQIASVLKDEQVVTLEYDLPGGRTAAEQYDMAMLYDFWVRMYMKRGARNGDPRLPAE